MEQSWSLVQERICRKCMDGDGKGNCRLPVDEWCPVKLFLPQIVETIASVNCDSYEAYVSALRVNVCSACPEQAPDGGCRRRDQLECALDRYYGLVLEVLEGVSPGATASGS